MCNDTCSGNLKGQCYGDFDCVLFKNVKIFDTFKLFLEDQVETIKVTVYL